MTTDNTPVGAAWLEIVRRPSLELFQQAFANDVSIETSVLPVALHGADAVYAFFSETRTMYERIAFTSESRSDGRTVLEWEGVAFGNQPVGGVTVLHENGQGLIDSIRLFHRPLGMVAQFSVELSRRLKAHLG